MEAIDEIRVNLGVIAVFLFSSTVRADDVAVTNASSGGWTQIAPNTFVLPADLSTLDCGKENETSCEPLGEFNLNVGFASAKGGFFNIFDGPPSLGHQTSNLSDVIHYFNGTNGLGVITFASDPATFLETLTGVTNLCIEGNTGCVASFTTLAANGSAITLTAAADGEGSFRPFGAGFDTRDGLKVTTSTVSTPEPGSLALLASGLVGLGILRRKLVSR